MERAWNATRERRGGVENLHYDWSSNRSELNARLHCDTEIKCGFSFALSIHPPFLSFHHPLTSSHLFFALPPSFFPSFRLSLFPSLPLSLSPSLPLLLQSTHRITSLSISSTLALSSLIVQAKLARNLPIGHFPTPSTAHPSFFSFLLLLPSSPSSTKDDQRLLHL